MNTVLVTVLSLATCSGTGSVVATVSVNDADDPFRNTHLATSDVRIYLHIDQAADLRAELTGRPIAEWVASFAGEGEVSAIWANLARSVNTEQGELFDQLLGRELTLIVDHQPEQPNSLGPWIVLTHVEPIELERFLRHVKARVLGPRQRAAMYELPEHDLRLAVHGRTVLVGPRSDAGLFEDTLVAIRIRPENALADHRAIEKARQFGNGRVGIFIRHGKKTGGWSVAVADLVGCTVSVEHFAEFAESPFRQRLTELEIDDAPLIQSGHLPTRTILASVEPSDIGGGAFENLLEARFGIGILNDELKHMLGPRQITVLGHRDVQPRDDDDPAHAHHIWPTFCRGYEVTDIGEAAPVWNEHMQSIVERIGALTRGRLNLEIETAQDTPYRIYQVDVSRLARLVFGNVPGVETVRLCWTIVGKDSKDASKPGEQDNSRNAWILLASDVTQLRHVADALSRPDVPAGDQRPGENWTNFGLIDTEQLALMLHQWHRHSQMRAERREAREGQPGRRAERAEQRRQTMQRSLQIMSGFAESIHHASWRMKQPSERELQSAVELQLRPPSSAAAPSIP